MRIITNIADGLRNVVANLGTARDKSAHTQYVDSVYDPVDLLTTYAVSWVARAGVDYPAEDAVRKWRAWRADADQISKIEAVENQLGLQSKLQECLVSARLLGGAAIYINTAATDKTKPLADSEQIKSLAVMTRNTLQAQPIVKDIDSEYYGMPEYYAINSTENGGRVLIHASRFVILHGAQTIKDTNSVTSDQAWGDSVLKAARDALNQRNSTMANIASLIFEAKVDVFKFAGFADMLAANQDDAIISRAHLQAAMKGINGAVVIDGQDDYDQKTASFGSLPELVGKFQEEIAGAFRIPVTRLFGRSAAGLSGQGDGDERVYYDRVSHEQATRITPALAKLDRMIVRQALGSNPAEIYYDWRPLRQITEIERSDILSKVANSARAIAGASAGEIIPLDALSDSLVNALVEMGAMPGLEQAVIKYGTLSEQNSFTDDFGGAELGLADAAPRSLYVSRSVTNANEIIKHYADQGLTGMLEVGDLHVTIAYSRQPVDWMRMGEAWDSHIEVRAGGARLMEAFGPQGDTLVLAFVSSELSYRHEEMKHAGASWDWPEYQPHITIANGFNGDLKTVQPWTGEIKLGPEIFEEVAE